MVPAPLWPAPPMPAITGLDDLVRAGLESYRDSCFTWLLIATGFVIAGLVLEVFELWYDIGSMFRHWQFRRRFRFSLPEEHAPNWAKFLAAVGWLFIVGGVGGEFVADSFVSRADGYVQKFDEILLAETTREAGLAKTSAQGAADAARKAQEAFNAVAGQVKGLEKQERELQAKNDLLGTSISKLQEEAAWRSVPPECQKEIFARLSTVGPLQIDFVIYPNDPEIQSLASSISTGIRRWQGNVYRPIGGGNVWGVLIEANPNDILETRGAITLVEALKSPVCRSVGTVEGPRPSLPRPIMDEIGASMSNGSSSADANIRLIVGYKKR